MAEWTISADQLRRLLMGERVRVGNVRLRLAPGVDVVDFVIKSPAYERERRERFADERDRHHGIST